MQFHRFGLIALALILVLPACGGESDESARDGNKEAAEKIVEKALRKAGGQDVDVDIKGDTVRFTGKDGDLTVSGGAGATLPGDFPKDIPIYRNAELITSASSQQEESFTAYWITDDKISSVIDFVTSGMERNGWKAGTALNMPQQTILSYTKGNRGASIMIAGNGEQTTINVSTAKE